MDKTDALAAASPFHQGLQPCLSCYLTHGCLVEVACVVHFNYAICLGGKLKKVQMNQIVS